MAGCMLLVSDISGAGVLVCWCVDAGVLVSSLVITCVNGLGHRETVGVHACACWRNCASNCVGLVNKRARNCWSQRCVQVMFLCCE